MLKNVYENEMKLEFMSKPRNEAFARITVASFAAQLEPTIEELSDIKIAVSEAVTNCIIHGYDGQEGVVHINCKIFASTLEIEIIDNGKGIDDIDKAREPMYTSKPEMERSGMGFTIMENFMEDMKIVSKIGEGTKITMTKIIGKNEM